MREKRRRNHAGSVSMGGNFLEQGKTHKIELKCAIGM